jgi:tRNA nucleotidyltransferase/poly(A) polymerase
MIREVAESNIEPSKIEIEVERNERIVLGRGKYKDMILVKLNLTIKFIKIDGKLSFPYELDLREIPKHGTYLVDPKTRDFTVNSGYYGISEAKVIDISNVT